MIEYVKMVICSSWTDKLKEAAKVASFFCVEKLRNVPDAPSNGIKL